MDRDSGKGILFGVLGVMTLIIAILGASLAYFTATARSRDDAVVVQSATVAITYTQGQILQATNLYPASQDVAERAYAKTQDKCIDDNGLQVCSVYAFETKNGGSVIQSITGSILTTTRCTPAEGEDSCTPPAEFDNLSYMVYETTGGTPNKINSTLTKLGKYGSTSDLFNNGTTNEISINSGETKKFEILVWLNELSPNVELDDGSGNQDHEQGLTYTGTVSIEVVGVTDKITGEIK